MATRSLRLSPGTPPDMVIAAFNGLAERLDAVEDKAPRKVLAIDVVEIRDVPGRGIVWVTRYDPSIGCGDLVRMRQTDKVMVVKGKEFSHPNTSKMGLIVRPLASDDELVVAATPVDVRQAVEHAVRETRTGLPDATAEWTLHLGPGCVAENADSGNRFTVEPGAVVLDAEVKLRVLDKAEALIDPNAKPKVERPTSIPIHRAHILGRVREVADEKEIWPARLDRRIVAGTLVHDGDWNMAWVVEVDHDDPEGFSTLRVQPLATPGH